MPEVGSSDVAESASIRSEPQLRGYTLEWADPASCVFSKQNRLYRAAEPLAPLEFIAAFPADPWIGSVARLRPVQRLLRHMFYNVVLLGDGSYFLTFNKAIGVLKATGIQMVRGLQRPCRVLRGCCAVSDRGDIYFSEYLDNAERGPMRVYRYQPGIDEIETIYTFPAQSIRHAHGIFADPWSGALWCTTGDQGMENRILRTADGFRTVDCVGCGDESWRAVSLQFTPDAIYYAMDAEFTENYIFRIDRRSGAREVVHPVEGPVYYSTSAAASLFFAVTAELCPSQQGGFAALWRVGPDGEARRIFTMDKDRLPCFYFMPGVIEFPRGPGLRDRLYFHTTSLKSDDAMFSVALTSH